MMMMMVMMLIALYTDCLLFETEIKYEDDERRLSRFTAWGEKKGQIVLIVICSS